MVAARRQCHRPDRGVKAGFGAERGQMVGVGEGFSGRKLCVSTPTAAMPAGVVTLLGAALWVPFPR